MILLQMKYQPRIPAALPWASGLVLARWANIPVAVQMLVYFIVLDFATGLARAYVRKNVSSEASLRGLVKKGLILAMVALAHLMERSLNIELGLEKVIAIAYTVNEAISIVENCHGAGVPVPGPLVAALAKVKSVAPGNATADEIKALGE